MGRRAEPASTVIRRRRTEDGAPYDARRSVQQQTHVVGHPTEGASRTPPPTGCASCRFQRSREVLFITPVTLYTATSVSLPPVGCTVLGAPWPRDCRVSLAAVVWLDRLHPRHPRRTRLASTAQHIQSRGHRPRTICEAWGNRIRHIVSRSVRYATSRRVHRPRCTVAVGVPSIVSRTRPA